MLEDIKRLHKCLARHEIGSRSYINKDSRAERFVFDLITTTEAWIVNLEKNKAEDLAEDLKKLGLEIELRHLKGGVMDGCADVRVFLLSSKSNSSQFIQAD